jgi:transposase
MNNQQQEVRRRLRILKHALKTGNIRKTCRYFGIARSSFYRWRNAFNVGGESALTNQKPVPKHHPNQLSQEVVDRVLYLRRKYHLGPIRIVWYMARYHGIKICDASVYRILCRNGLNRLPRNVGRRKIHTKTVSITSPWSPHTK